MQAYAAIQEGSRRKRNLLVAWMAWTILSKASSELGFTGLPLWSTVHICVDAKLRVDSFTSWWAHWEIRLREEGADVAFQNRRNIHKHSGQASAKISKTCFTRRPGDFLHEQISYFKCISYNLDFTWLYHLLPTLLPTRFLRDFYESWTNLENSNSLGVLPGEQSKLQHALPACPMKPSRGPERFFYDKTTYTGALLQYCSDPLNIFGSDPLNMLHLMLVLSCQCKWVHKRCSYLWRAKHSNLFAQLLHALTLWL